MAKNKVKDYIENKPDKYPKKPMLICMCGFQASGKSTRAKELGENFDAEVFSSDKIREELPNLKNAEVFEELYSRVNQTLKDRKNAIIDATNTTINSRSKIFDNINQQCHKVIYVMDTPYKVCVERLIERNASDYLPKIPLEVLERYNREFLYPHYEEGWDEIINHNRVLNTTYEHYLISNSKTERGQRLAPFFKCKERDLAIEQDNLEEIVEFKFPEIEEKEEEITFELPKVEEKEDEPSFEIKPMEEDVLMEEKEVPEFIIIPRDDEILMEESKENPFIILPEESSEILMEELEDTTNFEM